MKALLETLLRRGFGIRGPQPAATDEQVVREVVRKARLRMTGGRVALCSARAARLIQVPIIHTKADMGGLGEAFERALVARFGERLREDNQRLVDRFWTVVEEAVDRLPVRWEGTRLYQDGLPVCGREMEIVSELARAGSRNHQLLV